jgi:hypothetical protein
MSEYTPTTAEVSRRYMLGAWEESGDTSGDDVAQFDRWLASVKADAWDGGRKETSQAFLAGLGDRNIITPLNPYRGEQA